MSSAKKKMTHPSPLRPSRSFSRAEAAAASEPSGLAGIKRASTSTAVPTRPEHDAFESRISEENTEPPRASVDLEDLPIELISLTDSFIESLSAKVHPTPPNIENLAHMFQDFYATAAQHIQTHINSLATRQSRDGSPAPVNPRASAASILRAKAASLGNRDKPRPASTRKESDQQMLTAEEFAERKRARRLLEQKKGLYEEAVERRLCEGIYHKIYRHHTTQDEAQDDKLRSRAAALSVVGIGPHDLGVDLGAASSAPEDILARQEEVKQWLEPARKQLVLMNESRYPLGKLNRLKAAHKSIIDTLSHFHPSSSADELMPMLIYTLITMPPEALNVISDVKFIERFRWEPKLTGETAFCLTNLEAAISFLETVDLSTLRADEAPSGPVKQPSSSGSRTPPRAETFPPAFSSSPPRSTSPHQAAEGPSSSRSTSPRRARAPSPNSVQAALRLRDRRLSDLINTPAQAIGAASDAVDQSLKNISNTLGDSYKFLIGKLREQPASLTNSGSGEVIVPKTLDDARKLIGTPPLGDEDASSIRSEDLILDGGDSASTRRSSAAGGRDDKVLNLITGRKVSLSSRSRDRSVDSSKSARSPSLAGKDNAFGGSSSATSNSSNPALIDSVRNFGNSLNPMARLSAGIGGLRGFGRTTGSAPAAPVAVKDASPVSTTPNKGVGEGGDLATAFPDIAASLPPKEARKIKPPVKRFMEMENPGDLRLGEVMDLLRDYRRLAGALKDMRAFKE